MMPSLCNAFGALSWEPSWGSMLHCARLRSQTVSKSENHLKSEKVSLFDEGRAKTIQPHP
jgi:hypothetical protein